MSKVDIVNKKPYIERTKTLKRSHDYRRRYFEHDKGWQIPPSVQGFLLKVFPNKAFESLYFCPYCGRVMWDKPKIVVDHIHSIRRVQYTKHLREHFKTLPDGVNHISNLVACCVRCNGKKGKKGGLWVFRGIYGRYFMPIIRLILILSVLTIVIFLAYGTTVNA